MQKNNIDDKLFEALYKVAAEEALELDVGEIPTNEELNAINVPSPRLTKKVKKMISRHDRSAKVQIWTKNIMKPVVGVAVIVVVTSTVLLSVSATRNYIFNAILKWQEDHFTIEHDDNIQNKTNEIYKPTYLPENYEELSVNRVGDIVKIIYQNPIEDRITLKQCSSESTSLLGDNEEKEYTIVTINGQTAYLFEPTDLDKTNTLIWELDGILFSLSSEAENSELISIAESVEK